MTVFQIKMALELAKQKNFSTAAEQLFVSQSTLSKQIKALEDECGMPLFRRTHSGAFLTEEGKVFCQYAQNICAEYAAMKSALGGFEAGGSRKLIAGVFTGSPEYNLLPCLTGFQEKNQDVCMVIREYESEKLQEDMSNAQLDVVLAWEEMVPRDWSVYPLVEDTLLLVTAEGHPLAQRAKTEPISMGDARDEPFILFTQPTHRQCNLAACRAAGFEPREAHSVSHPDTLLRMVSSGHGVGLLYDIAYRYFRISGIEAIRTSDAFKTNLVLALRDVRNPASKRLAKYFREHYQVR